MIAGTSGVVASAPGAGGGGLPFEVPGGLEAHEPPEARGLPRDGVRLLVTRGSEGAASHLGFGDLPRILEPGDVLAVNVSATLPAAVPGRREDGEAVRVHFSTRRREGRWAVELRRPEGSATAPLPGARAGERVDLPAGGSVRLLGPHVPGGARLWDASVVLPGGERAYLRRQGKPIRYRYVPRDWPLRAYQTVFARVPGSAEMPSAGRAFTPRLVTRLVAGGVQVAPLVLHAGVASQEAPEPPYEERYRVPPPTAELVNRAREAGRRVVAVGTTVVRALESATDPRGRVRPAEGWTGLVVTPEGGVRAVTALLTGFHEPRSSHLMLLEAVAGREHVRAAYAEALRRRYLWHEFGDLHLILP